MAGHLGGLPAKRTADGGLAANALSCFRVPFPPGDRVTFNGKECMCQKCSLPKSVGGSACLTQGLWSKWVSVAEGQGLSWVVGLQSLGGGWARGRDPKQRRQK